MEYSVRDSLSQVYHDVLLTKQEGFVSQQDVIIHSVRVVIECKRHKGFSWNELKGYFDKLQSKAPEGYKSLLIFKANHQPCLVMSNGYIVQEFKTYFGVEFIKHEWHKEVKDEKQQNKDTKNALAFTLLSQPSAEGVK